MEDSIILLYNNKNIEIELPSKFKEFLKLLEDKLFLTPEWLDLATIYYYDKDGDRNIISAENYDESKEENNGKFEMEIDFFSKTKTPKLGNDENNNDDNNIKKKLEIEEKIAKKYIKIFEEKLEKKDLEHKNEISKIKENFEKTINAIIEKNKKEFSDISKYYDSKMKENFEKYNQMIINNLNKGISQSNLNELMKEYFNKENIEENNNEDEISSEFFSEIIKK